METLLNPTEVKANKDHHCDFCGSKIYKGSKYLKSTHKNDGDLYDFKTHDYCAELATKMDLYKDAYDGVDGETFQEAVSEKHFSLLTDRFAQNEFRQYDDILNQLRYVNFKEKLHYVIMHYKKLEKQSTAAAPHGVER